MGTIVGDGVQCPYHGWLWDGDSGRCTLIPALGPDGVIPRRARLATHQAVERYGLVWSSLADRPLGDPPHFPEYEGEGWAGSYVSGPPWDVGANVCASIENFRDVAHLPFVHRRTMGELPHPVGELTPRREGFDVYLDVAPAQPESATADEIWHTSHNDDERCLYHAIAPAVVGALLTSETVGRRMMLFAVAPTSLESSRWYLVERVAEGYPVRVEDLLQIGREITDEDVAVLENVRPRGFEAMLSQVHCLADAYTLKYREAFIAFLKQAAVVAPDESSVKLADSIVGSDEEPAETDSYAINSAING
jgi:phenylpropionate dioxygenase-like ring-hydroxylating dioxygenase large terminal subunit